MDSNKYFKVINSSFKLNNIIYACDTNEKYILIANDINDIEVYSTESFKKLQFYHIYSLALHIQFHPLYYNIFSITLNNSTAHLFNIDTKTNKLEDKVQYLCSSSNSIVKTMFSPFFEGKFLATLSHSNIKIWNMEQYSNINILGINYNINNAPNYPIKWSESGKYLAYLKNKKKIEIFSIEFNNVKYHINFEAKDFFFLENLNRMIILNNKSIIIWDIKKEVKIKEITHLCYFRQCSIDYNNSYIYYMDDDEISIFNLNENKQILKHKINSYSQFFILKNIYTNPNLFTNFLFCDFNSGEFEKLSISSSLYESFNFDYLKEAPNKFWENCVDKINNNFEFLSYQYNQIEKEEIHKKNYLSIEDVTNNLNKLMKSKTLEEKKSMVVDFMKNFNEDKDIYKAYLNYVNNLIKDNTNIDLLSNYLKFIKANNTVLSNKYENTFDNFNSEISQYQAVFDKSILFKELKYDKNKSEKEKLFDLFEEIVGLNKEDKNYLKQFINIKKPEFENFSFNQPISFENNKELFYCKNKVVILNNLEKIIKNEKYELIDNMKYCIQEVLKRKLFDKEHIKNNKIYNMLIIILIAIPQRKIITNYNLNLIDNEDIEVNEKELLNLGLQYDQSIESYKKDDLITIKKEEMNIFNLKNIKLYLDTALENIFKIHDLYKFDHLKKYYNDKFDENKVRNFISKILVSNVFKEAFAFFYGDDIKYPFIDEKGNMSEEKAKKFLDTHLNFVPLIIETTSAITEKFSMETYIFLNDEFVFSNLNASENIISGDLKLISKALINGALVVINDHEINHNYHNYYYCSKNGNETLKTPRKIEMNEREGGNNMEKILFGRVLDNLTLKQSLYILNEKNYEKPLNQFRKEFLVLKEEDCKCDGIFNEYSNMKLEVKEIADYIVINFKSNKNNAKIGYITFKLKDDVLGFPNFDEKEEENFDEEEF